MTKLNQIIAVEKGAKADSEKAFTLAYHQLQRTAQWGGLARQYSPKDEDGERLPGESTKVQIKGADLLRQASKALTRLFDVTATKDTANTSAVGTIVVDGNVLVENVPVPTLLFLEKRLVDMKTFLGKFPVLDPAEEWTWDATTGTWRSEPVETVRTKKIPRNHVKAAPTDKHPAQVEVYTEDVSVGTWKTTKFSGALPQVQLDELLEKVSKLLAAVKYAREEANSITVTDQEIGEAIFAYLDW